MNKMLSIILLLALLPNILVSCGNDSTIDNQTSDNTTTTEPEEENYLDTLPKTKYTGQSYRMLGVDYATRRNFPNDEEVGDIVNDALYDRNKKIEELYDINIEIIAKSGSGDVKSAASQSVLADDDEFDIIISSISDGLVSMMNEGLLYDINSIPYIDSDAAWWSSGFAENTAVNGELYITMGDISPMKFYAPYVMAFNQRLIGEYTDIDMFDTVLSGKWTNDLFYSIIKDINNDIDGDGDIDGDDFHGYAHVDTAITSLSHFVGAGRKLSTLGKDGNISIDLNTETSIDIMENIGKSLQLSGGFDASGGDQNPTVLMFKEGRALFFGNSYSLIIATFREMDDDFGIIPVPKGDEEQENYYSYINTWCLAGVAFPKTIKNIEMIGVISEAMGYLSYKDVRTAIYDTTMKVKVARDDKNGQILDMIFDNTYIDLNGLLDFGGSTSAVFNTISKGTEFSSAYASIEQKVESDIEKLINK